MERNDCLLMCLMLWYEFDDDEWFEENDNQQS